MRRVCLALLISVGGWMTAQAQAPAVNATAATLRSGNITGRVVTDDGQPLVKAQVQLVKRGAQRAERAVAHTDAEGNFTAPSLSAGVYGAYVQMPGYTQADVIGGERNYRLGDYATLTLTKGGVITGRIQDEDGEPLVKAPVTALRMRTLTGNPLKESDAYSNRMLTDDRGVYRFYGLPAGIYQVSAVAAHGFQQREQLAIYYPSSPRAAAAEVTVQTGGEATGIDIRLRKLTGFTVSGTVAGVKASGLMSGTSVTLRNVATGTRESGAEVKDDGQFVAVGVPEGDYEICASTSSYIGEDAGLTALSQWVRVSVRGADVSGVALRMNPLASLKGRVVLEPLEQAANQLANQPANQADKCSPTKATLPESLLTAHSSGKTLRWGQDGHQAVPDEQGRFQMNSLEPGTFWWSFDLPAPTWYVRTMAGLAALATTTTKAAPQASDQFTLKPGQALGNVVVTVAANAARLQGRVVAANGAKLPARLRIHLVPADTAQAEDLLRYDEAMATSDGAFQFDHIAPGKYWLLAQTVAANEPLETQRRMQAWDNAARAKLRKDAELAAVTFEARPCSVSKDFKLEWKK